MSKTWQVDHFACANCGIPIKGNGFYVEGKLYCCEDYRTLYGKKCSACGKVIETTLYTALDRHWHPGCFVCKRCNNPISSNEFTEKRGVPYCMNCSRM